MHRAIEKSDIDEVSNLLNNGANPNSKSLFHCTNLGFAVIKNDLKIVELLLHKEANPNLKPDAGSDLPLCYAILNKNLKMVQLLLKYKANPSYKPDYCSNSPIKYAQMMLGYPSLNGSCHPIVACLLESIKETNCTDTENIAK
jgi:ankyrin repeat protein